MITDLLDNLKSDGLKQNHDIKMAVNSFFNEFLHERISSLKDNNLELEKEIGMSFVEYEQKIFTESEKLSLIDEKRYLKWDEIISSLEYFKKISKQ